VLRGNLAPARQVILDSTTPEEAQTKLLALFSDWDDARAAEVVETALAAGAWNGVAEWRRVQVNTSPCWGSDWCYRWFRCARTTPRYRDEPGLTGGSEPGPEEGQGLQIPAALCCDAGLQGQGRSAARVRRCSEAVSRTEAEAGRVMRVAIRHSCDGLQLVSRGKGEEPVQCRGGYRFALDADLPWKAGPGRSA